MNLNFKEIFAKQEPSVRVRARREMMIKNFKGKMVAVKPGDELDISASDVGRFDADDISILKTAKELAVQDPSPPRPEVQPAPEAWKALPVCFNEFHQLSEELRTAAEHVDLIISKREYIFGGRLGRLGSATGKVFMGRLIANADDRNKDVTSVLTEVDMDDPEIRQIDRFLSQAEDAAADYLKRLRDTKSIVLQRLFLACGYARLEILEKLQGLMGDLADTGFYIFQARLSALGLHAEHERRLFLGSADYIKYGSHGIPASNDFRSAGLDENLQPMLYIDMPVIGTAEQMIIDMAELARFAPLLVEAKRELAQALKKAA